MSYTYLYPRCAVTADAAIFRNNLDHWEILLIQRGKQPYIEDWALPGGFMEMDETLETCAIRELFEETSLKIDALEQFKTYDSLDRDPRHRTISTVFWGICPIEESSKIKASDDAQNAKWFSFDKIPKLAFDHQVIVNELYNKLFQ